MDDIKIYAIVGIGIFVFGCIIGYKYGRPDEKEIERYVAKGQEQMKNEIKLREKAEETLRKDLKSAKAENDAQKDMINTRTVILWGGCFVGLVVVILSTVVGASYRRATITQKESAEGGGV